MKVSAFLTGRNYSGLVSSGGGTFADDDPSDIDDNELTGWFSVNDPANNADPTRQFYTPGPHNQINKYNDLERRKTDLCVFINTNCHAKVIATFRAITRTMSSVNHD